jgi:hypothetical protein
MKGELVEDFCADEEYFNPNTLECQFGLDFECLDTIPEWPRPNDPGQPPVFPDCSPE